MPAMPGFKKNHKGQWLKNILLKLGAVALAVLSVKMIASNVKMYREKRALDLQMVKIENTIQSLQRNNDELREGIEKADDMRYLEKIAREEMDMKRPGEKVVSFIVSENQEQSGSVNQGGIFFSHWFGWIGGAWNWIKTNF